MDPQSEHVSIACLDIAMRLESEADKVIDVASKFRAFIDRGGKPAPADEAE